MSGDGYRWVRYRLTDARRFVTCLLFNHKPVGVWPGFCGRCGCDTPAKRWPR